MEFIVKWVLLISCSFFISYLCVSCLDRFLTKNNPYTVIIWSISQERCVNIEVNGDLCECGEFDKASDKYDDIQYIP